MKARTKNFRFFQGLNYILLIIWLLCGLDIIHQLNFFSLIITGGLLLFINMLFYSLANGEIEDLNINQIKQVWWAYVFLRLFLAILISITILVIIKLFNPIVVTIRAKPIDVGLQIIGGLVAGIIGFVSAMFMYQYEQKTRTNKEEESLVNQIWFEILNNKILLELDLKNDLPFFRRLESNCWNSIVASRISIDGRIKGGILVLYGDIDFYNYICQLSRVLIAQGAANSPQLVQIVKELKDQVKFPQNLLDTIRGYSGILFGEMVRLGYKKEADWADPVLDWKKHYNEFRQGNKT